MSYVYCILFYNNLEAHASVTKNLYKSLEF